MSAKTTRPQQAPRQAPQQPREAWRVEALEPRVLLSADPVFGPLQAILLPALFDADPIGGAYDAGAADGAMDAPTNTAIDAAAVIDAAAGTPQSTLVIGRPGSSQAVVFDRPDDGSDASAAPIVSSGDIVVWADGVGGEVFINQPLIVGSLQINGSGHTTTLAADVTALTGDVQYNDSVKVSGARSITVNAGFIQFGDANVDYLGGNSAATVDTLTLSASGNITFRGPIGDGQEGSDPLSGLTVLAAGNVTFDRAIIIDGNLTINATGIVNFKDQITLKNGGSLVVLGATQIYMQGRVILQTGNAATPGDLVLEANEIDLTMGEELIEGSGKLTLRPATVALPIAVMSPAGAGTAGVLNLETVEMRAFADGFSGIVIGHESAGHAAAGTGAVLVGANANLDGLAFFDSTVIYGGTITVVDYSDRNAVLRLGTGDTLRLEAVNDITLVNEIEADRLTIVSTAGRVVQTDAVADNRIGEALRTPDLVVQAATGVTLATVEVQRIDVLNTGAGDISVGVGAARTTTRFDASVLNGNVDVLRLGQTAASGGNDIALTARAGSIVVVGASASPAGSGIAIAGSGGLILAAQGAGSDITLNAPTTLVSGTVLITAADALRSSAAGSITASGAAPITLQAVAGDMGLLAPVTSNGGAVSFASGGVLDLSGITVSGGAGGQVNIESVGNLTIGIVEATVSINLRSTTGAIIDGLAGNAANLRGEAAAVVLNAATGLGSAAAPLRSSIGSLAATNTTSGGIFIAEETALTIAAAGLSAAGNGAAQGAILVTLAAGSLAVQGKVESTASGAGSGHILLQTAAVPGDITLAADVISASGSISILASQAMFLAGAGAPAAATVVRASAAAQTIDLRAGSVVLMSGAASLQSSGGAQRIEAAGGVVIGRIDAGYGAASAAPGAVSVQSGGFIIGAADAPAGVDITASALRLQAAGGGIGDAADALAISVTSLGASAFGGAVFLRESDGLLLGTVGGVVVNRVAATGSAAPLAADGAVAGVIGLAGVSLVLDAGSLTVQSSGGVGAGASGHVLLQAPGSVTLNAPVASGAGQISVIAGADVLAAADGDILGGGAIDIEAGGVLTMADGAVFSTGAGGAARLVAGGALALGQVNAGTGHVNLAGASVQAVATGPGADITGADLRIGSAGQIGVGANPLSIQVQRLAAAAGGDSLFLAETDAVQVAALGAFVSQRVQANGSLATTPVHIADTAIAGLQSAGALVLQAGGTLTVDAGAGVQAATALRLAAAGSSDLDINAAVASSGAVISLQAGRDLLLTSAVAASGAGKSIELNAGRDLLMAASGSLTTQDAGARLASGGNVSLGRISAGSGSVSIGAAGNVSDADGAGDSDIDISAAALRISAGGAIGQGANGIETTVGSFAANAGAGLFVSNDRALLITQVTQVVQGVNSDGSVADLASVISSGLSSGATGAMVLTVLAGDLQFSTAAAAAGGALLIDVRSGSFALNAPLSSAGVGAGGAISVLVAGVMQQAAAGDISSGGGSVDIQTTGALTMADGASISSGGGLLRVAAGGALTVGVIDAGAGAMSISAAAVRDIAGDAATGADLSAASLRLVTTGTAIADGVGSSADAIETALGAIAAELGGGGLFINQAGALTVQTAAAINLPRVQADGTVSTLFAIDAALSGLTSPGALVVQASGSLQSAAGNAISAGGNLLLSATGTDADLVLAANLSNATGHASLLAGRDITVGAALALDGSGRTLELQAGRALLLAQDSALSTRNGAVLLRAETDITIESINAGTAAIAMISNSGSITEGDVSNNATSDAEVDVTAGSLRLNALGAIGLPANAIETSVGTLTASAGAAGLFITETSGLRIDKVTVAAQRVGADASAARVDLADTQGLSVTAGGVGADALSITVLAGDLTLEGDLEGDALAASNGGGALLLDARLGKITVNDGVSAAGALSLLARTDIVLAAAGDIDAGGSLDLQAGGAVLMADGTLISSPAGNIRIAATGLMTVGAVVTAGDVSLLGRGISDAGGAEIDISSNALRVVTTGTAAGQGFGAGDKPLQLQVTRLAATVAGVGASGFFAVESDGLEIDSLAAIAVDRVNADGSLSTITSTDAALSDLVSAGNIVILSDGAITLRQGSANDVAVQSVGNLLLHARGGALLIDGAVRSSSGHISLLSGGDIVQNADIAITRGGRNVDISAAGSLAMAETAVISVVNSPLRIFAGSDVRIARLAAGNGDIAITSVAGSIVESGSDADVDISAAGLWLNASSGGVGSAANRIETRVGNVTARAAGGGIWLHDSDAVRIGDVEVTVRRVGADATVSELTDVMQSDLVTIAGNGSIGVSTIDGDIDLTDGTAPADGRSLSVHGHGAIQLDAGGATAVLDVPSDTISQQGPIVITSALRIQGIFSLTAGTAEGAGDGPITLNRAVDGNPGGAADRLELHSDGAAVRVLGAIGATTPLNSLLVDDAGDVTFEETVHLSGDLVIEASGVVEFKRLLTIDSGSLTIVGASAVVMGGVVIGAGDVVIEAGSVLFNGVLQGSAGGMLNLAPQAAGGAVTIGAAGSGLVVDAAMLAQIAGFGEVQIGQLDSGVVSVSAALLEIIAAPLITVAGGRIDVQGSASLAGKDLVLDSSGAIAMAADASLGSAGGDLTLRGAADIAVGQLDTRGAAAAGSVLLASSGGTISDAARDTLVNIHTGVLVMRGHGPLLAAGASSSLDAVDVQAARLDIDAAQGVVLRDSGLDGKTRFNLVNGDLLYQQLVAEGAPPRGASAPAGASGALGTADGGASIAAWLGALRPLAELRDTDQRAHAALWQAGAGYAAGADNYSEAAAAIGATSSGADQALDYLAALTAGIATPPDPARHWLLGQESSQPWASGASLLRSAHFEVWSEALSL